MKRYRLRISLVIGSFLLFGVWCEPVRPQALEPPEDDSGLQIQFDRGRPISPASSPEGAVTTQDPDIPTDELELLLKPLTLEELEVELAAWLQLLRAKAQEVSQLELAVKRQNQEIATTQDAVQSIAEAGQALEETQETKVTPEGEVDGEAQAEVEAKAQEKLEEALGEVEEAAETEASQQADADVQAAIDTSEAVLTELEEEKPESSEDEPEPSPTPTPQKDVADVKEQLEEAADVNLQELESSTEKEIVGQQLEVVEQQLEQKLEEKAEVKTDLLVTLTELRDQQTALLDRFDLVLDSIAQKGGDVEIYRKYSIALGGIKVDVTDSEAFWLTIWGWIKSDEGGKRWAINLGKFFGILIGFGLASWVVGNFTDRSLAMIPNMSRLLREFIVRLVSQGMLIVGLLLALTALEVSLGPLIALVGGASFVLAFALQSNLGNFASGLMILFYKPFDVGDEVEVAGISGKVESIDLAITKLSRTGGSTLVTIPNNLVWEGIVTNFTPANLEYRKIELPIHVESDQDLVQVKQLLVNIANSHEAIVKQPKPEAFAWEYSGSHVEIRLGAWTNPADYWQVYEDLIVQIQANFKQAGIAIAGEQELSIEVENAE